MKESVQPPLGERPQSGATMLIPPAPPIIEASSRPATDDQERIYRRDRFESSDESAGVAVFGFPRLTRQDSPEPVRHWKKNPDEWLVSPKVSAAVVVGSLILFNFIGNAGPALHDAKRVIKDSTPGSSVPYKDKAITRTVISTGAEKTVTLAANTASQAGEVSAPVASIKTFVNEIKAADASGTDPVVVIIKGNTSNEWGNDASIGVSSPKNYALGLQRGAASAKVMTSLLKQAGITKPAIEIQSDQHIVPLSEKAVLETEVQKDGFPTIISAIESTDDAKSVPKSLGQTIKRLFSSERGTNLSAIISQPGKTKKITEHFIQKVPSKSSNSSSHSSKKDSSKHEPLKFFGFIPLPPIRKRRHVEEIKKQWNLLPGALLLLPLRSKSDNRHDWLRLRPEARKDDGTLVERPWTQTAKYQTLLREGDRFKKVIKARFTDSKDGDRTLRATFVDMMPGEETIDAFKCLLFDTFKMQNAKKANRITDLFVFPKTNAGTKHGDYNKIGLGIDRQLPKENQSVYIPALGLVEMTMDPSLEGEDLTNALYSVDGPLWTAAENLAGNGSNVTDHQLKLEPTRKHHGKGSFIVRQKVLTNYMSGLRKNLDRLSAISYIAAKPLSFDTISYKTKHAPNPEDDTILQHVERYNENDSRVFKSRAAALVGFYALKRSKTTADLVAETAAAVTTGITIPFSEAEVEIQHEDQDGHPITPLHGYQPSLAAQNAFLDKVGGSRGTFPIGIDSEAEVSIDVLDPKDDALLVEQMRIARKKKFLHQAKMISFFALTMTK